MSWKREVEGIEERLRFAREQGGVEAVERRHAAGRFAGSRAPAATPTALRVH